MKESYLWRFILKQLEKSKPVVLLCVVESRGSSPGRQGFKMAVTGDEFYGSIGGGIMEHKFVELAKEMLINQQDEILLRRQVHNKLTPQNQSGMICSGEQTIVVFPLDHSNHDTISTILNGFEKNEYDFLEVSPLGIFLRSDIKESGEFYFEKQSDSEWVYRERIGIRNHLYIVGGGHCGLALSRQMSNLGFLIHIFDERPDLNTMKENTYAIEKRIVPDYYGLNEWIPGGENSYVVIMTFGYRTDDIALRALIDKEFKYLGVLGSDSKMDKLYQEWKSDGLPKDKLGKIFSPIGLKINSRTPEEIAVSIAAEIIMIKNNN